MFFLRLPMLKSPSSCCTGEDTAVPWVGTSWLSEQTIFPEGGGLISSRKFVKLQPIQFLMVTARMETAMSAAQAGVQGQTRGDRYAPCTKDRSHKGAGSETKNGSAISPKTWSITLQLLSH